MEHIYIQNRFQAAAAAAAVTVQRISSCKEFSSTSSMVSRQFFVASHSFELKERPFPVHSCGGFLRFLSIDLESRILLERISSSVGLEALAVWMPLDSSVKQHSWRSLVGIVSASLSQDQC